MTLRILRQILVFSFSIFFTRLARNPFAKSHLAASATDQSAAADLDQPPDWPIALRTASASWSVVKGFFNTISSANSPLNSA